VRALEGQAGRVAHSGTKQHGWARLAQV
jgi:hypothetical protein